MTTCPSGVHYMHLLDQARAHIEATYRRPMGDRLLRWLLARLLPYPARFRAAMIAAKFVRPFRQLVPDRRLRAMLDMAGAPIAPPTPQDKPQCHEAAGPRRKRVVLLTGCAQKVIDPAINPATIDLLTRQGVEVVIPEGEGCCGAIVHHMGLTSEALPMGRANIAAWIREIDGHGLDAIIVNTSGCGTTIKDYGHLFAGQPEEADAVRVAALCKDVSEFLIDLGLPDRPTCNLTVAYHAACSLQHGQKVITAPVTLLKKAGFRVLLPAEGHLCCGSAGTYNLLQPELSEKLRARKVGNIEALRPDAIAAGNIGCLKQIGSGTSIPVVHTVELLNWAYGGQRPDAIGVSNVPKETNS
jgi:glycolate oxidase iron-sulfur subunit